MTDERITWTCPKHGVVPPEQITHLTWDSPHNEELHTGCGSHLDWVEAEPATGGVLTGKPYEVGQYGCVIERPTT